MGMGASACGLKGEDIWGEFLGGVHGWVGG